MPLGDQVEPQRGYVPTGIYMLLITDVNFGRSAAKGTPFVALKTHIVQPTEVKDGNQVYAVGGTEITKNFWLSDKALGRALQEARDLGVPQPELFENIEELSAALEKTKGCYVQAVLESKSEYVRQSLSPSDVAAGKKDYEMPFLTDENGQKILKRHEVEVHSFRPGSLRAPEGEPNPF